MRPFILSMVICLGFAVVGCGGQPAAPLTSVEELQRYFEREGFTFTHTPTTDFATRWGQNVRVGRSEDDAALVAIYGNDTPTRLTMSVRRFPLENRAEVYAPQMVVLLQTMMPEWGDANTWVGTQIGLSQNQLQHEIQESRGKFDVEFSGTPDLLNLSTTLKDVYLPE